MDMIESYTLKYNFGEWNARIEKYLNRLLSKIQIVNMLQCLNQYLMETDKKYIIKSRLISALFLLERRIDESRI